jgi:hypothetical protein
MREPDYSVPEMCAPAAPDCALSWVQTVVVVVAGIPPYILGVVVSVGIVVVVVVVVVAAGVGIVVVVVVADAVVVLGGVVAIAHW